MPGKITQWLSPVNLSADKKKIEIEHIEEITETLKKIFEDFYQSTPKNKPAEPPQIVEISSQKDVQNENDDESTVVSESEEALEKKSKN